MVNKTKGNADYISTLGDEEQEDRIRAGKYTQDESAIVIHRKRMKTLSSENQSVHRLQHQQVVAPG